MPELKRFATTIRPTPFGDRFDAYPFILAQMLEEAVIFLHPNNCAMHSSATNQSGRDAGKCWVVLEITQLVGALPRWRFARYSRQAKSTSFGTGFTHEIPNHFTIEMMEEVFFRTDHFPPDTYLNVGYVAPNLFPHYKAAIGKGVLRNADIPGEGYVINFSLGGEAGPMEVPSKMNYVLDLKEDHAIFLNLRLGQPIYQSLLAALESAHRMVSDKPTEQASTNAPKVSGGTDTGTEPEPNIPGTQLRELPDSGVHFPLPSDKWTARAANIEAFALDKSPDYDDGSDLMIGDDLHVDQPAVKYWEHVEKSWACVRNRLEVIKTCRDASPLPLKTVRLPADTSWALPVSVGVGTAMGTGSSSAPRQPMLEAAEILEAIFKESQVACEFPVAPALENVAEYEVFQRRFAKQKAKGDGVDERDERGQTADMGEGDEIEGVDIEKVDPLSTSGDTTAPLPPTEVAVRAPSYPPDSGPPIVGPSVHPIQAGDGKAPQEGVRLTKPAPIGALGKRPKAKCADSAQKSASDRPPLNHPEDKVKGAHELTPERESKRARPSPIKPEPHEEEFPDISSKVVLHLSELMECLGETGLILRGSRRDPVDDSTPPEAHDDTMSPGATIGTDMKEKIDYDVTLFRCLPEENT